MSDGLILAIDQGTTGTKVILFNHSGELVNLAYGELTQHYPRPGWVEHDPNEIWSGTLALVAEAMAAAGCKPQDIKAIGITNQRETTILWDRISGEPVAPAVVWQDRRTAEICDELRREGLEQLFKSKTGLVLDAYFSGTKVKWLLDNVDGLRQRANRGEIAFGTVDSWLLWKMTGGAVHLTDYSNASRTLLYNIHELNWDDQLLSLLDIPPELLPSVSPSSQVYATTDPGSFFGLSVPIAGIAGDQQAALFGQACFKKGMAKNTYGTGSFVLLNTGHDAVKSAHGMLTTIAWGIGSNPVEYALEGAVFITGAAIQWLRDGLGIIGSAFETERMAFSLNSNDGVFFVPALAGLGAPHWDPYARGAIVGLTRGTTRAHFARAALESICFQSLDVFKAMERDSGVPLKEIRADGGAVSNSFLMQFQADMLGVPVVVPAVTETTAAGAAYLAGLAVGFWNSQDEIAVHWKPARRFEPEMAESERQRLHGQWLRAVEHAKGWETGTE
jgi:glycerol kinase